MSEINDPTARGKSRQEQKSESLYGDPDNRIRFIEDFFYSLFTLYPRENFFFHTAANIMLLLFQQPLAIAGFRRSASGALHLIWSSVADPEFSEVFKDFARASAVADRRKQHGGGRQLVRIPGTNFFIGLYELHWEDGNRLPERPTGLFRPAESGRPDSPVALLRRLFSKMDTDPHAASVFGTLGNLFEQPYQAWLKRRRLADRREKKTQPSPAPSFAVSEADIAGYIERIRTDLIGEEIYPSLCHSPLLTCSHLDRANGGAGKAPFPDISFLLRTGSSVSRCGHFRYSLRLLFPEEQLDRIAVYLKAQAADFPRWDREDVPESRDEGRDKSESGKGNRCSHYAGRGACRILNMGGCIHHRLFPDTGQWAESKWKAALSGILHSPLGSQTRMMADSAFTSGVMEICDERAAFGRARLRVDNDNPQDIKRFRLLSCLIHQLHSSPQSLLYPIMVSGTPWITISMAIPQSEAGEILPFTWMMTFHFVHTILRGKVIDRLRAEARGLYLTLLQEEFLRVHALFVQDWVYTDLKAMKNTLNDTFRRLAFVFPYDQVEVSTTEYRSEVKSRKIDLLFQEEHGLFLFCRLVPNPNFDRIVKDRSFLDIDTVAESLRAMVRHERERIAYDVRILAEYQETLDTGPRGCH